MSRSYRTSEMRSCRTGRCLYFERVQQDKSLKHDDFFCSFVTNVSFSGSELDNARTFLSRSSWSSCWNSSAKERDVVEERGQSDSPNAGIIPCNVPCSRLVSFDRNAFESTLERRVRVEIDVSREMKSRRARLRWPCSLLDRRKVTWHDMHHRANRLVLDANRHDDVDDRTSRSATDVVHRWLQHIDEWDACRGNVLTIDSILVDCSSSSIRYRHWSTEEHRQHTLQPTWNVLRFPLDNWWIHHVRNIESGYSLLWYWKESMFADRCCQWFRRRCFLSHERADCPEGRSVGQQSNEYHRLQWACRLELISLLCHD